MEHQSLPTPKKGLSTGAKIGIGCGGIALLVVIAMVIAGVMLGGQVAKFAEEAVKDPTRATVNMMVKMSSFEIIAEDQENKRYTLKEKSSGKLTTVYWSEKTQKPEVIEGDFSAIPAVEEVPPPAPPAAPAR